MRKGSQGTGRAPAIVSDSNEIGGSADAKSAFAIFKTQEVGRAAHHAGIKIFRWHTDEFVSEAEFIKQISFSREGRIASKSEPRNFLKVAGRECFAKEKNVGAGAPDQAGAGGTQQFSARFVECQ